MPVYCACAGSFTLTIHTKVRPAPLLRPVRPPRPLSLLLSGAGAHSHCLPAGLHGAD